VKSGFLLPDGSGCDGTGFMAVKLNRSTIGQTDVACAAFKASRGMFVSAFAAVLLALVIVAGSAVPATGQARFPGPKKDNERNAPKNLTGQVVDKNGAGVREAIVYLKDKKTLEMKTHISDEKGAYRFTGLDPNEDYEVHAESKGALSSKRTVSSFDDRKEVYLVLELGAAK
jgi:hypothetical protein